MSEINPFTCSSKILINCGNIASWNKLKKKSILTSTAELLSTIENTLISYAGSQNSFTEEGETCIVRNAPLVQTINTEEQDNLLITLKVFPTEWSKVSVAEAIEKSLKELGIASVNTIILSFPQCPESELTLEKIQPLWEAMEEAVTSGKTESTGTADLDKHKLQQLYEWATIKPSSNQMNLAYCCTIPEDLVAYAKEVNIRLMTHNDERYILPLPELHSTLSLTVQNSTRWHPNWITRYNSVIKMRGIVSHKGYLVELQSK